MAGDFRDDKRAITVRRHAPRSSLSQMKWALPSIVAE